RTTRITSKPCAATSRSRSCLSIPRAWASISASSRRGSWRNSGSHRGSHPSTLRMHRMKVRDPSQAFPCVVPAGGASAVGVSGGGDSVALLELLRHRRGLSLHVVHLDHETGG